MRKTCLEMVYELAKKDKRIFFVGSDLGFETLKHFKEEMPDRFFMEGVSEANVIGMAAGLALEGKIVYVNTIATFLTRRCFEQVVLDAGLHQTNIRLIGNGGGLVYAPLGPTHLAIEDIAIMRAIPHMTIVACADANEMRRFMSQSVNHQGPMYIRLAKGHDPIVTPDDEKFEIGKAMVLGQGQDALLITTGITLRVAKEAIEQLKQDGIEVTILHMPTIKPLDVDAIKRFASKVPIILTVEEHTIIGGLGSAVAEVLAESDFGHQKKFKRIGIPDVFAEQYGSQNSLMDSYNISSDHIVEVIKKFRKKSTIQSSVSSV